MDHTALFDDLIEEIAAEKTRIIKPGSAAVLAPARGSEPPIRQAERGAGLSEVLG